MSSTPLDLPILISQLPYVARLAHAEKAKPEIEKQIFGPLLQEQLKKKQGKVQQVDKKQRLSQVDQDGRGANQQTLSERHPQQEDTDEQLETETSNHSPWSGNIVDVKI
ncbi:hypothetical protein [Pseudodesulfovibrio piezophilus]|uniref:hypothetical protein n=1 Tax=Pseudodesulfovibrio piezophilus TaxID=879567 RepID=UPI000349BFA8|nr:hypothetical protein [Pseudodesulfovibrio piezophilus]